MQVLHPRTVRSYVRRDGRKSTSKTYAFENLWTLYGLDPMAPQDFEKTFQRQANTILEIGFGMGQSFIEQAVKFPELNFIGIEVHRSGIACVLNRIAEQQIPNIRLYDADAKDILRVCIPDNSLSTIQIFFPDPWPKRRHHKRRLIQAGFVEHLAQKLQDNGKLHLATDWEDYAKHMLAVLTDTKSFENCFGAEQFAPHNCERPATKFENRGKGLGHGVWDLYYKKIPAKSL